MRPARWQPVCPECAYQLRGSSGVRCPECGTLLPTTGRFFRRWAFHRLPWDRLRRSSLIGDYLRTSWALLARPAVAAPRLAHPDRWGRALRWALVHLLITASGTALLSRNQYFIRQFVQYLRDAPPRHPSEFLNAPPPPRRAARWFAQSTLAWVLALASVPALGALLSTVLPCRHRAAALGGVKFTLYLTALLPIVLGVGWIYRLSLHPLLTQYAVPGGWKFPSTLPAPLTKVTLTAALFAVWWAVGLSANPYNRSRGFRPFMGLLAVFMSMWWVLTRLVVPAGPLVEWL